MTREEIEKEAEESSKKAFCVVHTHEDELIYKNGYLAGAEPREKRITELEEKLNAIDKAGEHVRQQINNAFRDKPSYAELEKENAELKVLLDCKNCSELSEEECEVCAEASHFKFKGKDQLTKAKEIIYRLMDIINHDLKCFDTMAGLDVKQKAEQFLKEIER